MKVISDIILVFNRFVNLVEYKRREEYEPIHCRKCETNGGSGEI